MPTELSNLPKIPAAGLRDRGSRSPQEEREKRGTTRIFSSYRYLLLLVAAGSLTLPVLTCYPIPAALGSYEVYLQLGLVAILTMVFYRMLRNVEPWLIEESRGQAAFLESISSRFIPLAIVGSAAVSLLLELAIIRWQGTVFEFFAFYKNYGLLACFAGLGLGYALSQSEEGIPLALTIPLFGWQFLLLIGLRYGLPDRVFGLSGIPFREQLNMGMAARPQQFGVIYLLLTVVFLLTALAFLPVGQLCGKLMERTGQLSAYGMNLLGSLLGVGLMFLVSYFWAPPLVWFALCFLGVIFFLRHIPKTQLIGVSVAMVALLTVAWPVNPLWNKVYSPYQMLEVGYTEKGLMIIRAAGHYYQRVHNLSDAAIGGPGNDELRAVRNYYDMPYKFHPGANDVAIVGAGSGNDVAAALRSGAMYVDAIEIDPAILLAGKSNHPEHPYADARVHPVVNDARSFFRTTDKQYDVIVYGLLDSHTLLSQASSVRLDSFVYTIEGLREARSRLKENGVLSLSFSIINDELGTKIFQMMKQAFDGKEPLCFQTNYDLSMIFVQNKNGDLVIPPGIRTTENFTKRAAYYRDSGLKVDLSTDDWPFLYMPHRVYPVSYLLVLGSILVMSLLLYGSFFRERPEVSHLPFFFLGAGFMLVETKAITEMGLTFGNTWQVIALAIGSILVMAFLANALVQRFKVKVPWVSFLLLFASLVFGWWIARAGGLPSTTAGRIGTLVILTVPLFFSGIVFSALLSTEHRISSVMAMNLMGTMCGGILEYNSMYFGFRFLYVLALGLYLAALVTGWASRRKLTLPAV
jgi:predicted membrane-bound spermidine synthase